MFRWLLAPLMLILLPLTAASPGEPWRPAKNEAELIQRITKVMIENKVQGLSLAMVDRKGSILVKGLGCSDVASGRPATQETLFRIGSISKMLVGLSALRLVEEGRLDLQAKVKDLVPEVAFTNKWEVSNPVRVVHLLEHTTGWDDDSIKEDAQSNPQPRTLVEDLSVGPESRTCRWRPGTRYAYCSPGTAVVAYIVEKVTGQRFEDYVEATFFKPLGMTTADYFLSPRSRSLLTNLYHKDGRIPFPYWHCIMRPTASINASAQDMAALLRFFLRRGEGPGRRLLSETSLQRMETPTTCWGAVAGLKTGYGLCNHTSFDGLGLTWHGHGGSMPGCLSELGYRPEQGVGYFFSINASSKEAFKKISTELQLYFTWDLPRDAIGKWAPITASLQTATQGWYIVDSNRRQRRAFYTSLDLYRVEMDTFHLRFKPLVGKSTTYFHVGSGLFRNEKDDDASLAVLDTPEGRMLQFNDVTYHKVGFILAWASLLGQVLFLLAVLSVPVFALVWGVRWLFRRMKNVQALHVRMLPLLAVMALVTSLGLPILGREGFDMRFGILTPWSLGVCLSTWAFAILSLASLVAVLRAPRQAMNRWVYYHSLGVSVMLVIATLYLAYWGVIGLRTWA